MDSIEEARKSVEKTYRETKSAKSDASDYVLDTPGVVDVLDNGKKLVYLNDDGETTEQIKTDKRLVQPPPTELLPYLLPRKDEVIGYIKEGIIGTKKGDAELYERIEAYHRGISDLPNELFYDLLVLWDVHTYLLDRLHFSPMLYFYAVKERGKSRTGKSCIYISRRGVWTETIREADIIRWGNDHKAALGFDAKDFPKKIQKANCDDLILARFEAGSTSSRTLWPERGAFKDTKTFNLFGPTIIATNRPVDDILESRCISINMKPSSKIFNNPVLPEDALVLKTLLAAFRFQHRNTKLAELDKPVPGRLGDILSPLQTIVATFFPEKSERFNSLVKIISEQKQDEATDTFEAQIVEAIVKAEEQVVDGFLPVDIIASLFNEGKDERFVVRNDTVGRVSRGLGFSSRRTTGGKRGIYYDPELIKKVAFQYGIITDVDLSETASLPSLPTTNNQKKDASDTSDSDSYTPVIIDVFKGKDPGSGGEFADKILEVTHGGKHE